ncbi:MAG: energy transducer TonB [Bacteroidota bacterium]
MKWIILFSLFPILLQAQTPTDLGNASDQAQGVFDQLSGEGQKSGIADESGNEQMPLFLSPECEGLSGAELKYCSEGALLTAIYSNIMYPAIARENGVEGMPILVFNIEVDGTMSELAIENDPGGGIGEECMRLLQSIADRGVVWSPGLQFGEAVRVGMRIPVKFYLEDDRRSRRARRRAEREARRRN